MLGPQRQSAGDGRQEGPGGHGRRQQAEDERGQAVRQAIEGHGEGDSRRAGGTSLPHRRTLDSGEKDYYCSGNSTRVRSTSESTSCRLVPARPAAKLFFSVWTAGTSPLRVT